MIKLQIYPKGNGGRDVTEIDVPMLNARWCPGLGFT